jgi:hypothetical protein
MRNGERSRTIILAISVWLVGMANTAFAFDTTKWKYCAEVTIKSGTEEYCRLALTPEVYNAARIDLGDIRLADGNGRQVPYVIVKPRDTVERQQYKPTVINRSTSADKAALVTLDFGEKVIKNSIDVITQGSNFRRAVRVEGSNDNVEFFTLVQRAYVFAVGHNKRFEQVDLPTNDYHYLRITVWPMTDETESPVIEEMRTFKVVRRFAERQTVEMATIEHQEDEKDRSSIYIYDLAYRRLPISEIELDVAGDSFYRFVTLEGRDEAKRKVQLDSEDNIQRFTEVEVPWERIVSDTIYRYSEPSEQKREKLVLHLPTSRNAYRYLRLEISNYDDEPVVVKSASAKMIADQMVFPSPVRDTAYESNANLTFYVGSVSEGPPRYDLRDRLNNPSELKTRAAILSGIAENPLFREAGEKPAPWTERHRVLLLIAMAAVVLVLGGFILKSFKSIRSEQPPG